MAGVIPKDKLTGYQRWNIGSLDAKSPAPQPRSTVDTPGTTVSAPPAHTSPSEVHTEQLQTSAEELERIHKEARTAGYSEGYREGQQAGQATLAASIAESTSRFTELLGNFQTSLAHLDQHVADQVLGLALEVATQVLRSTISARPELLLPVIREAIAALPLHHAHVVIRLCPADARLIREQIGEQLSQTGTQIIEDPEIAPGGCLLVAGASEVDATIETRWKRVLEAIGANPSEWMSKP